MATPARAFLDNARGIGLNAERTNVIGYGFNTSQGQWDKKKSEGMASLRQFIAYNRNANYGVPGWPNPPNADTINSYLDVVALGVKNAVPVFTDALEVMNMGDAQPNMTELTAYMKLFGTLADARKFPSDMATFGCCNEWAGGTNASWAPIRNALHATLRAAMPTGLLTVNAGYWGSEQDYTSTADPFIVPPGETAKLLLAQLHCYDANGTDPAFWRGVVTAMNAWSDSKGHIEWHIGEAGLNGINASAAFDPTRWNTVIAALAAGAPDAAPCVWCFTNGNAYQMNQNSGVADLHAELVPGIVAATKAMRAIATPPPIVNTEPSVITVTVPATLTQGATSFDAAIATTPPLPSLKIAAVSATPPDWPFYGVGFDTVTLAADGTGSYPVTLRKSGDFLKYGPPGGPYVDTPPIAIAPPMVIPPVVAPPTAAQIAAIEDTILSAQTLLTNATGLLLALKTAA